MTYLYDLISSRRAAVDENRSHRPVEALQAIANERCDRRDFKAALRRSPGAPLNVVAEFKRASPSAGPIAIDADAAGVAASYERGGAAAISVLTEPERFLGGFDDLRAVRTASRLPVLCKDFIVDAYQVWEAAAEGADAVLLIVAALDAAQLRAFVDLAAVAGMDALVEAHDETEATLAVTAGAAIVGINNRDLQTFAVDVGTAHRIRESLPPGVIAVAESGYSTSADVRACADAGFDAVLVGESLMRAADRRAALRALRADL